MSSSYRGHAAPVRDINTGGAVRERLLKQIDPAFPLTILSGLAGTGKARLLRQWYDTLPESSTSVFVNLPAKILPPNQALAHVIETMAQERHLGKVGRARLDQLLRGNLDLPAFEAEMPELLSPWQTGVLVLARYEWHSSPVLDHLIISAVRMGFNVVCSLVDATDLSALAASQGVAFRVIEDAELNLTSAEVGVLATRMGWQLEPKLQTRVVSATGGNPALSAMVLLCLKGLRGIISSDRARTPVWQDVQRAVQSQPPAPVDPASIDTALVGQAAGLLLEDADNPRRLMGTTQSVTGIMSLLRVLVPLDRVPMRALEELWPGSPARVRRLCAAGYARIEYDGRGDGVFVWTPECQAAFANFVPDHDPEVGAFVDRLARWEGAHGRYRDALLLCSQFGSGEDLEAFCRDNFLRVLWDDRAAEVLHDLGCRSNPSSTPVTVLLSIVRSLSVEQDAEDVARIREAAQALQRRMDAALSKEKTAEILPELLSSAYAVALLRSWDAEPDLERRIVPRLREVERTPEHSRMTLAKTALSIGLFALLRVHADEAVALFRLCRRNADDDRIVVWAEYGLHVLAGLLGEQILDSQIIQRPLPVEGVPKDIGTVPLMEFLSQVWGQGLRQDPQRNRERVQALVKRSAGFAQIPVVIMTAQFVALTSGDYEEAYQLAQQRVELGQQVFMNRFILFGTLLAALRTERLSAAKELQEQFPQGSHLAAMARSTVYLAENLPEEALQALESYRVRDSDPMRFRAGYFGLQAALNIHLGRENRARSILLEELLPFPDAEIQIVLHFLSKTDVRHLLAILPEENEERSQLFTDALDGEHILPDGPVLPELSSAELEVLRGVEKGLTNREIAAELFLSPNTVKSHLRRIFQQLGANSRAQAVKTARNHGLL